MRILHTEWSDGMGGQEKRVLAEASGMLRRGHTVSIACRDHAQIKGEAMNAGIDVRILPMRRLYDVSSMIRLACLLRKEKYHVVNTHSGVDSWIGGVAAKLAGSGVLIRTRHLNIPLKRSLINFIHYLPDMFITCGENMRHTLVNDCSFPADRVVSIPTGVSVEKFEVPRNKEAKKKFGLPGDAVVITNVGILRKVKGHEVTLRAVKQVTDAIPNARFLIVGDGPRKAALKRLVLEMGIERHVVFTGFVDNIAEVYSFSDASILSSWSEGLPQSLLQAMASGVPVVASRVGGVPEVVRHEQTGLLFEAGDSAVFAREIIRVVSEKELSNTLIACARPVAREHSLENMLDRTEELYASMLKTKQTTGFEPGSRE